MAAHALQEDHDRKLYSHYEQVPMPRRAQVGVRTVVKQLLVTTVISHTR